MIVTLTLNPSLDLTYTLAEQTLGEVDVHRATASTVEASGKGVNVSRTLNLAGAATTAVLPVGGATGAHLRDLLTAEGVEHVSVPVPGETRINTSLLTTTAQTVKVNGPGAPLHEADLDQLREALVRVLDALDSSGDDHWLGVCGSLPPAVAPEVIGDLVGLAHAHSVRCAVDVSGPALAAALAAGADLLAPNSLELGELVGADLAGAGVLAVAGAANRLAAQGRTQLLVSMGGEGAVHSDGTRVLHGTGPLLSPVNTAGAGDAFLAGWFAVPGSPEERMARAMAFGRSACLSPSTVDRAPGTRGTEGITVTPIKPHQLEGTHP